MFLTETDFSLTVVECCAHKKIEKVLYFLGFDSKVERVSSESF